MFAAPSYPMSSTALPLEGTFFFTEVDPEVALKDSRDPLGFQPIWSHFGRKLVGNLTTVTTSVRGFTTMLLGHHIAGRSVDSGAVPAAEYIESFLRFEQIAAYSRIAWLKETGDAVNSIRGIRRVEARYKNGHGRVRIAADRDGQILANQKTYGLWGLYSVAATNSGLLLSSRLGVTPKATAFLEKNVFPALDQRRLGGIDTLLRLASARESYFEPAGKDKALGRILANLHGPSFEKAEQDFYSEHLIEGAHRHPDGRQKRLWSCIEKYSNRRKWREPFNMVELASISAECAASKDNLDQLLAEWLNKIRILEHVLVPAEQVFDYALGQREQPVKTVARELQRRWDGAFRHLDRDRFSEVMSTINEAAGDTETSTRLRTIASCLKEGRFEEVVRVVIRHNEQVMQRRSGGAWLTIKNDRIEVRYSDQTAEPMDARELPDAWRNTYFLNALKTVGAAVSMKETSA
jgi:hypothetical protein